MGGAGGLALGPGGGATGDFAGGLGAAFGGETGGDVGGGREELGGGEDGVTSGGEAGGVSVEEGGGDKDGVTSGGEAGGVSVEEGGGDEVARVSISTFIPARQWPGTPQMKYLLPEVKRVMDVLPPVYF